MAARWAPTRCSRPTSYWPRVPSPRRAPASRRTSSRRRSWTMPPQACATPRPWPRASSEPLFAPSFFDRPLSQDPTARFIAVGSFLAARKPLAVDRATPTASPRPSNAPRARAKRWLVVPQAHSLLADHRLGPTNGVWGFSPENEPRPSEAMANVPRAASALAAALRNVGARRPHHQVREVLIPDEGPHLGVLLRLDRVGILLALSPEQHRPQVRLVDESPRLGVVAVVAADIAEQAVQIVVQMRQLVRQQRRAGLETRRLQHRRQLDRVLFGGVRAVDAPRQLIVPPNRGWLSTCAGQCPIEVVAVQHFQHRPHRGWGIDVEAVRRPAVRGQGADGQRRRAVDPSLARRVGGDRQRIGARG